MFMWPGMCAYVHAILPFINEIARRIILYIYREHMSEYNTVTPNQFNKETV